MKKRKWFIDYCQLWISTFDTKRLTEKKLEKASVGLQITLDKYQEEYNLKKKTLFKVNKQGIKIHLKGSFFLSQNFHNNVDEIAEFYSSLWKNVIYNWTTFNRIVNPLISRLDLACNIPLYLNTHKWQIHNPHSRKQIQYFTKDTNPLTINKNITGIAIGNKGSDYLFLRVYDKRFDPNNFHDYIRFGSTDFTRLEYQIGRKIIKNNKYKVSTLSDLSTTDPNYIGMLCTSSKNVYFLREQNLNYKIIPSEKPMISQSWEHALPTTKSIITRHMNYEQQKELGRYLKRFLPHIL